MPLPDAYNRKALLAGLSAALLGVVCVIGFDVPAKIDAATALDAQASETANSNRNANKAANNENVSYTSDVESARIYTFSGNEPAQQPEPQPEQPSPQPQPAAPQQPAAQQPQEPVPEPAPAPAPPVDETLSPAWVAALPAAAMSEQLVVVEAFSGSSEAMLSLHAKLPDGTWHKQLSGIRAYVGKSGVGQAREGLDVTPAGTYPLPSAFGILPSPGSLLPYTPVDETHYWVSDTASPWYNQLVSTRQADNFDKDAGEHLCEYVGAYDYAIEIGYNTDHVAGAGSAFFIHCSTAGDSGGTEGCVAVSEETMVVLLQNLRPGSMVVIGDSAALHGAV